MPSLRRHPRDPEGRMSLGDHFREFRNRLLKSALAVLLGGVVGWILYNRIYDLITAPMEAYQDANPERNIALNLGNITAGFSLHLSVAIFAGVILSSPIWLYQAWAFIVPGLTKKEKRISRAFIAASVPLFLAGIALAHYSLTLVIGVLLDFTPTGAANFQGLSDYISFVTRFSLGFGFAFLLPVVLVGLNMVGILPSSAMLKAWRPAVFIIFVISAMLMPTPDPYSMMLLAVPLTAFFFIAIGVAKLLERKKVREQPEWMHVADDEASTL